MKNTKALKFFAVMAVALLLALTSVFASAEEDAKTSPLAPTESSPTIVSQNIAYQGSFNLCYAVDAASVSGGSVTVNIYDAEKNYLRSYTATTTESITPVGGSEVEVYVVITSPIATKDMGDVYYAQAVDVDGNVGALKRYSVAEYLFEMLYDNGIADAEDYLPTGQALLDGRVGYFKIHSKHFFSRHSWKRSIEFVEKHKQ